MLTGSRRYIHQRDHDPGRDTPQQFLLDRLEVIDGYVDFEPGQGATFQVAVLRGGQPAQGHGEDPLHFTGVGAQACRPVDLGDHGGHQVVAHRAVGAEAAQHPDLARRQADLLPGLPKRRGHLVAIAGVDPAPGERHLPRVPVPLVGRAAYEQGPPLAAVPEHGHQHSGTLRIRGKEAGREPVHDRCARRGLRQPHADGFAGQSLGPRHLFSLFLQGRRGVRRRRALGLRVYSFAPGASSRPPFTRPATEGDFAHPAPGGRMALPAGTGWEAGNASRGRMDGIEK